MALLPFGAVPRGSELLEGPSTNRVECQVFCEMALPGPGVLCWLASVHEAAEYTRRSLVA